MSFSGRIHAAHMYSQLREYRKIFLANHLCIGFVPGGKGASFYFIDLLMDLFRVGRFGYFPTLLGLAVSRNGFMEKKKPIKKNHIKEFSGRKPRNRPKDKFGKSLGHLGRLGRFMCKFRFKGRMSARQTGHVTEQMGHVHGTEKDTHQGLCRQNSLCLLFFFPH